MCASKINGNMRANTLAEQRLYILWHTASSSYGYRKRSEFAPFSQNRTECFVKPVKISIFNIKHEQRRIWGRTATKSLYCKFYGWMKRQMYQIFGKQTYNILVVCMLLHIRMKLSKMFYLIWYVELQVYRYTYLMSLLQFNPYQNFTVKSRQQCKEIII